MASREIIPRSAENAVRSDEKTTISEVRGKVVLKSGNAEISQLNN